VHSQGAAVDVRCLTVHYPIDARTCAPFAASAGLRQWQVQPALAHQCRGTCGSEWARLSSTWACARRHKDLLLRRWRCWRAAGMRAGRSREDVCARTCCHRAAGRRWGCEGKGLRRRQDGRIDSGTADDGRLTRVLLRVAAQGQCVVLVGCSGAAAAAGSGAGTGVQEGAQCGADGDATSSPRGNATK